MANKSSGFKDFACCRNERGSNSQWTINHCTMAEDSVTIIEKFSYGMLLTIATGNLATVSLHWNVKCVKHNSNDNSICSVGHCSSFK